MGLSVKVLLQDIKCENMFGSDSFTLLLATALLVAIQLCYLIVHLFVSLLCLLTFPRLFTSTVSVISAGFIHGDITDSVNQL